MKFWYAWVIMTMIVSNLQMVRDRIVQACDSCGRNVHSVELLAVAKTFGAAAVREAYAAGQVAFGENYIQEAVEKMAELRDLPLQWHCIGPVQSNKSRLVAEHFDWVHSIDRLRIAERLSAQRPSQLTALNVCIQVNIDGAPGKAGVAPDEVASLAHQIGGLPYLKLRGLMTLPEPAASFAQACAVHGQARQLFDRLNQQGLGLDTLSMGMSGDLEAAVRSGSTMVRVGSAIFGARQYASV